MNVSKAIKYVVSLACACVLLYFSFKGVDWQTFLEDLKSCSHIHIVLTMLVSIVAFWLRSQRWKCLLRPIDPTIDSLTTFNCVNIGYLANFVFPRIGEVVRCGFVNARSAARHKDDPENVATFDKTLGTVLMSRSWDVAIVFLMFGVLLAAKWSQFGDFFINKMWGQMPSKFDISIWWAIAAAAALLAAFIVAAYIFRGRSKMVRKIVDFCRGIGQGFISWAHMPRKWLFFVWTILLWLSYWLMCYLIFKSIPALQDLGAVDALFVSIAGSFAWMVPVPGGFGAYHYFVALALSSVYGLDWDTGLICATLNHETQAITMLVCGIISYVIETIRK